MLRPDHIPTAEASDKMPLGMILSAVLPILLIGLIITISIYTGIVTPTEAAAVSCVVTALLAFLVGLRQADAPKHGQRE